MINYKFTKSIIVTFQTVVIELKNQMSRIIKIRSRYKSNLSYSNLEYKLELGIYYCSRLTGFKLNLLNLSIYKKENLHINNLNAYNLFDR